MLLTPDVMTGVHDANLYVLGELRTAGEMVIGFMFPWQHKSGRYLWRIFKFNAIDVKASDSVKRDLEDGWYVEDAVVVNTTTVQYRQEDKSIEITFVLGNPGTYIEGFIEPYSDSSHERRLLEECLAQFG
jgi:hypothetical protein